MPRCRSIVLLIAACLTPLAACQTPDIPRELPGLPDIIFTLQKLEREDPAMGAFLRDAIKSADEEVLAMLRSDDPEVISLGIWIADYHGRPDLLVQTPHLLDDERRGLSRLSSNPASGVLVASPAPRIRSRYFSAIHFWMPGLPYEGQPLRDALEAGPDPWARASTWSRRLHRAMRYQTPEEFNRVKREFLNQPETVKWLVALDRSLAEGNRPVFTPAEVKAILDDLSPDTKRAIADRSVELPPDFQRSRERGHEEYLDRLFDRYDALVRAP